MKTTQCAALFTLLALAGCAHHPADDPADPLEPVNRAVYKFNDTADRYVLRPVAKGYVKVTPGVVREGVTNFFDNLAYPKTILNDFLQAKFKRGASDLARFLVNSLYGIGGLIDVGSRVGLAKHDEDFGQTLGWWGVGEGWFLMLPLLGPSDGRDAIGMGVDLYTVPTRYIPGRYDVYNYSATALNLVNLRANLLPADSLLREQFDPYLFIRTAYLQRRQSLVYDGNPPPEDYGVDEGDNGTRPPKNH